MGTKVLLLAQSYLNFLLGEKKIIAGKNHK